MNYLFFDTETTGLPLWNERSKHPDQPHIVQLACVLCDEGGAELTGMDCIIKPEGYTIPKEASDIHGITTERALEEGLALWRAVWSFERSIGVAGLMVAHNMSFDKRMLRIAYHRLKLDPPEIDCRCTMKELTPIMKLPGNHGFKWPRLEEAYQYFFNEGLEGAHDAMVDVRACARIFFEMERQKKHG